jgi:predicted nucleic acid-binding Zn ribbon protein
MKKQKKKSDKWQIQRERCRLDGSEPLKGLRSSVSVSNVVPSLMKKLGIEDLHWLNTLEDDWPAIVGDAVAKHTCPGTLADANLIVFVDSSVWMSELTRYGKGKMLENLQERFGKGRIKTIGLRLNPDA